MFEIDWVGGLSTNLVSSVIWTALGFGVAFFNRFLARHTKVGIPVKLLVVAIFLMVGISVALVLKIPSLVILVPVTTIILAWWSLRGLFRVGLIDAFATTSDGITPSSALKLTHESIEFLGIGANKLTSDAGFEDAIRRCSSGGNPQACRFLLSHPDNKLLETLSKRNGAQPTDYKSTVENSLKVLARLKINNNLSVDVKFYHQENRSEYQQFRLMIVNNALCLASWTVWDKTLGMNNPQIVLRQSSRADAKKVTLYRAFKEHFEEMWEEGEAVDLQNYL